MRIHSIQVGLPRQYGSVDAQDPLDLPWESGFFKQPVTGPIAVGKTNLEGDGQADLVKHGGPDKAICAYPLVHYAYWQSRVEFTLTMPAFGENLTLADTDEESVCIGDVYSIGHVVVQVSQPRQPCWKIGRRWRLKELTSWTQQAGYTGWYFRVIETGMIEAGLELELLERMHPEWTIARANDVRYRLKEDLESARILANLPTLSESWRSYFIDRVNTLSATLP